MSCRSVRLASGCLVVFVLAPWLEAQESRFDYDPEKVRTGVVYQYLKSNIDGSNSGHVSIYVAAKDRLESLKWHDNSSTATLVVAHMDWKRFSVRKFETWQLRAGESPQQAVAAEYDADQDRLLAKFRGTELSVQIENWPWHSFDFDLASLNFSWRHLLNPRESFTVGITDPVRTANGPRLVDKGIVTIDYRRTTPHAGHLCHEYLIDGPGLEHKGGTMWVRADDGVVIDYEIALPDEPGFTSAKLQLIGTDPMSPDEWRKFKADRVR